MQAALHQGLALGLVDQLHGLCGRVFAVRRVNDLETTDIDIVLARHGGDSRRRPDQDGNDEAGRAASAAPPKELSSQGLTTMVVAGGTCLARAIKHSYFAWVCTGGATWETAITNSCGPRCFGLRMLF